VLPFLNDVCVELPFFFVFVKVKTLAVVIRRLLDGPRTPLPAAMLRLALLVVLSLQLVSGQGDVWEVYIDSFEFNPAVLNIVAGDMVWWTNIATPPQFHSVTADDGSFASWGFSVQGVFNWTFLEPGTFEYHCNYVTQMKGTIVVFPPPETSASETSGGSSGWSSSGGDTASGSSPAETTPSKASSPGTKSPTESSTGADTTVTVIFAVVVLMILLACSVLACFFYKYKRQLPVRPEEAQRLLQS